MRRRNTGTAIFSCSARKRQGSGKRCSRAVRRMPCASLLSWSVRPCRRRCSAFNSICRRRIRRRLRPREPAPPAWGCAMTRSPGFPSGRSCACARRAGWSTFLRCTARARWCRRPRRACLIRGGRSSVLHAAVRSVMCVPSVGSSISPLCSASSLTCWPTPAVAGRSRTGMPATAWRVCGVCFRSWSVKTSGAGSVSAWPWSTASCSAMYVSRS